MKADEPSRKRPSLINANGHRYGCPAAVRPFRVLAEANESNACGQLQLLIRVH